MRAVILCSVLAGACVPDPCDVARRNISLGAFDATTRAVVQPIVTIDGAPPSDLVCTVTSAADDHACEQVAFTAVGPHTVVVTSQGFLSATLMIDGGSMPECGRDVPTTQITTSVPLTPVP